MTIKNKKTRDGFFHLGFFNAKNKMVFSEPLAPDGAGAHHYALKDYQG